MLMKRPNREKCHQWFPNLGFETLEERGTSERGEPDQYIHKELLKNRSPGVLS